MTDITKRIEALLAKLKAGAQAEQSKQYNCGSGHWVPKNHEDYWMVTGDGGIGNLVNNSLYDGRVISQGNAFCTEEEAEREKKRREVMHRLRVLAKGFKPDWGDANQMKWGFYYDHNAKKWDRDCTAYHQVYGQVYFATDVDRDAAIAELGADLDYLL